MPFDDFHLVGGQRPGFGQDAVRDADLADVVQQRRHAQRRAVGFADPAAGGQPVGVVDDARGVAAGGRVLDLDRARQHRRHHPVGGLEFAVAALQAGLADQAGARIEQQLRVDRLDDDRADAVLHRFLGTVEARSRGQQDHRHLRPAAVGGVGHGEAEFGFAEVEIRQHQVERLLAQARDAFAGATGRRHAVAGVRERVVQTEQDIGFVVDEEDVVPTWIPVRRNGVHGEVLDEEERRSASLRVVGDAVDRSRNMALQNPEAEQRIAGGCAEVSMTPGR